MSISFDGSTNWLAKATALKTAVPMTFVTWINFNSVTLYPQVMLIGDSGASNDGFVMELDTGGFFAVQSLSAGVGVAADSALVAATGTWYHWACVFTSTTSRTVYVNAANSATNATSNVPTVANLTQTSIGNWPGTAIANAKVNGIFAFPAMWNVALSLTDITSLYNGISPLHVQPSALMAYLPVSSTTPGVDLVSSTAWTMNGTATVSGNQQRIFGR